MTRQQTISRTTLIGSAFNLLLTIGKLVAGIFGHSAAMVADGVHSLSDFVSDIIILIFVKISGKGKDKGHDYGHGKFETLASLTVSLVLLVVAGKLIATGVKGINGILHGETVAAPGKIALWAAAISVIIKELMFRYTLKVGKDIDSSALMANAWHHRSDALSSIASLVGIGAAILLGDKWVVLDPAVCVGIGIAIIVVAVKMAMPSIDEFLEASLPEDMEQEILEISKGIAGVIDVHDMQTRRLGHGIIVDEHVVVDPEMKLVDAHNIATEIEKELKAKYGHDTQIHIHMEPSEEAE